MRHHDLTAYGVPEELAGVVRLHPKVIRKELKLSFLTPSILGAVLGGESRLSLANLRNISSLGYKKQLGGLN